MLQTDGQLAGDQTDGIEPGLHVVGYIAADTHISASGNIQAGGNVSASGNLYGNNFYSNGVKVIRHDNGVTNFGTSGNNGTFITGSYLKIGNDSSFHITASGDISASGDLHVGSIATLGTRLNANKIGNNGNVGNTEYGHLNGVTGPIQTQFNDISNVTSSYAVTGSDVLFNHITASGHISASGDVRAQPYMAINLNILHLLLSMILLGIIPTMRTLYLCLYQINHYWNMLHQQLA